MAPLIKIDVVAAVILNDAQEILIAKRLPTATSGDLWEFPGGKIEKDETHLAALSRELAEELGIQITHAEPWMSFNYDYSDRQLHPKFYAYIFCLNHTDRIDFVLF